MKTLVVDASALVEVLLRTPSAAALEPSVRDPEVDLHVPSLCDLEVTSVLRKGVLSGALSGLRGEEAIEDYLDLPLTRHGHEHLVQRCFRLRDRVTPYDAAYIALAEGLDAALVTTDRRLARAAGALGIECLPNRGA